MARVSSVIPVTCKIVTVDSMQYCLNVYMSQLIIVTVDSMQCLNVNMSRLIIMMVDSMQCCNGFNFMSMVLNLLAVTC